jgi:hypothetical protein
MPFVNPMLFGTSGAQGVAIVEFESIFEGGTPLGRVFLSGENQTDGTIVSDPDGLFSIVTDFAGNDLVSYNFYGDYKFTLIQNYSSFNNMTGVWLSDGNTVDGVEQDIFQLYNGSILTPSPVTITVDNDAGIDHFRPSYLIATRNAQASGTLRIKVEYLG